VPPSAVTAPLAQAASDKAGAWASGSKAAYEGAVQTGTHRFYAIQKGKPDRLTAIYAPKK